MPFQIDYFPNDHLVIKTFWGILSVQTVKDAHHELVESPLYQSQAWNGLNDFRNAHKNYSFDEVKPLHKEMEVVTHDVRWCALESKPKETAMSFLYLENLEDSRNRQVFSSISAAAEFLRTPSLEHHIKGISEKLNLSFP